MGNVESCPPSRVVETNYGKVVGRRLIQDPEKPVDAFQGIPFAKPPLGELRFKKPEPPLPWQGERQCVSFGPAPYQKGFPFFRTPFSRKLKLSEDCLYLNVFTPAFDAPEDGFPVMVFIHGGAYLVDCAKTYGDVGICRNLVARGVVVVTMEYRLGFLGFFSTGDSASPGNYGLWDQLEALKYVQENIGYFGGNKLNVTVFGQSAGGASADLLSLSPHAKGLMHKVIPMAGNACAQWACRTEATIEKGKELIKSLGLEEVNKFVLMNKLRELPAEKFLVPLDLEKDDVELDLTPVIDGDFFPEPLEVLRSKAPAMPRMTGVTRLENSLFMMRHRFGADHLKDELNKAIPSVRENDIRGDESDSCQSIMHYILNVEDRDKVMSDFVEMYKEEAEKHRENKNWRAAVELQSDLSFNNCTMKMVQECLQGGATVYTYIMDHCNPRAFGFLRFFAHSTESTHVMELPFLFDKGIIFDFAFDDDDKTIKDHFATAFVNFARYGDPNGQTDMERLPIIWKAATKEAPETHTVISLTSEIRDSFLNGRTRRWLDVYKMKPELTQ